MLESVRYSVKVTGKVIYKLIVTSLSAILALRQSAFKPQAVLRRAF